MMPPPQLPISDLQFASKIDFVTVYMHSKRGGDLNFDGKPFWVRPTKKLPYWVLTIHDPSRRDILMLKDHLDNPRVMEIEIAVDLFPKHTDDREAHQTLLETTFKAVAARFRPEDNALWAYGKRGAVSAPNTPIEPLERRMANAGEQVIYGHRGGFMQAKLYLKIQDQGVLLPYAEQLVRMEVHLRRGACMDERINMDRVSDLIGYKYRKQFTKHFRLIKEPTVLKLKGLDPAEHAKRQKKMWRAWCTAGVAKFAISATLPEDTLLGDIPHIRRRQRVQLPREHYGLLRDQGATAKIGNAIQNLERRMARV